MLRLATWRRNRIDLPRPQRVEYLDAKTKKKLQEQNLT
jgi:hypothetical protein